MNYLIVAIIVFIFSFILLISAFNKNKNIQTINKEIEKQNNELAITNKDLTNNKLFLLKEIASLEENQKSAISKLNNLNKSVSEAVKSQEDILKQAADNYCQIIEKDYQTKEKEIDELLKQLDEIFYNQQFEKLRELDEVKKDLDKIRATRAAAIEAQKREQKIKDSVIFYCLQIPEEDKKEIAIIKDIEYKLKDPRPLRMLIWSSYYLKRANELAGRVLKTDNTIGIYKITNQITNMSYIGQARNMKERWREHMKAGLGIDTPTNNSLYMAMQKDGLENFTFELLEECSIKELDEKEKTYISLYDTYSWGYNQNKGIGKGL